MRKHRKRFMIGICLMGCIVLCLIFIPNVFMVQHEKKNIIPIQVADQTLPDCAIIFGAGVRGDKPTPMLRDRLLTGISLYESGAVRKLLMSGDHGSEEYDEVNVMKAFAREHGVPDEDIFMDHAGFSTYETMYRAKEIFDVHSAILVSQTYHLYRALYVAERLGIEAKGVSADLAVYRGQRTRDLREILARDKDFALCLFKPKPTYLGDKIPVSGNGNGTNDIQE